MATRGKRLAKVALLLAIAMGMLMALLFLRQTLPRSTAPVSGDDAGALPADGSTTAEVAEPTVERIEVMTPASSLAPLPALGTPLRLGFEELKRRADAGEPLAACRLAAEFARCEVFQEQVALADDKQRRELRRIEGLQDATQRQRMRAALEDTADREADRLARESEHCDGVPRFDQAARAGYWRRAALGGHLPSMRHYAVGNAFRWREMLGALPALTVYRAEAERIARQAAAAGDVPTLLALAASYSPLPRNAASGHFLAQVLRRDGRESLALYRQLRSAIASSTMPNREMMSREIDGIIGELEAGMPPAERAAAEQLAQRRTREWAAPRITGILSPGMLDRGSTPDIDAAACVEPD